MCAARRVCLGPRSVGLLDSTDERREVGSRSGQDAARRLTGIAETCGLARIRQTRV